MSTIVTRAGKGSPLSHAEVDANFTNLNTDKLEATLGTGVLTALETNVGTAGSPVVNGGALGTPSSGTLTSVTGLPAAGVVGTALTLVGGNMTGGINSARGNITQHATTMDFFATTSPDILDGTGSAVTITACVNAPQAGATRKFYPIVATVLTHGATFDVAGNANLTADAGDCWIIEAKTVSTYRVTTVKEDGTPVIPAGALGNVLTSDGTKWNSTAPTVVASGSFSINQFNPIDTLY